MKCFKPYFKKLPYSVGDGKDYSVPYPCGRCEACRKQNADIWTFRLQMERTQWQHTAFITLTYNNEHCPKDYSVSPAHVQSFLKRLRYYLPYRVKYFLCGEYGTKKGRPHYHLIVFGLKPSDYYLIDQCWTYGFNRTEPSLSDRSLAYVAQYVQKKIGTMVQVFNYYDKRIPPFLRCSKGIGISFVDMCSVYTQIVKIGGYTKYIGRYLKNKLAEKFGILEKVKEQGYIFGYNFIDAVVSSSKLSHNLYSTASLESLAYEEYITQYRRDFISRLKLRKERIFDGT